MRNSGRLRVLALAISDCLLLYTVWAVMVLGYHAVGAGKYDPSFYMRMWPAGPAFIVICWMFGLYHGSILHPAAPPSPVEELRRLAEASVLTHLGIIAVLAFAHQTTEEYSRFVIAASGIFTAILAQPCRNLMRRALAALDIARIPVFVAGGGDLAKGVCALLKSDDYIGFRVMDRFGDDRLRDVVPEAKRRNVRILVACQDTRLLQCQMAEYSRWFTHVEYLPTSRAFPVLGAHAVSFGGYGGLEMVNQGCIGILRLEKWMLDRLLSLLAFVAMLPAFVVIPLVVKATSKGPVFYRQTRLGKNGKPMRIWKFRSMYDDADERLKQIIAADPARRTEWESNFKLSNDPRVTPVGRFLRRTSLDELPQLFNVLAGEMALIGPRPIVEKEVTFYGESFSVFSSVKPGITGLWQVSGRSDTDYASRVAFDTYYVMNWSPWLDMWILFRTVTAVISMRGAC